MKQGNASQLKLRVTLQAKKAGTKYIAYFFLKSRFGFLELIIGYITKNKKIV